MERPWCCTIFDFFFVECSNEGGRCKGSLCLEQSLAHGTADQGAANGDSLEDSLVILERGVDLHQVHRDQAASLVDGLADVMALTEGQTATNGGT